MKETKKTDQPLPVASTQDPCSTNQNVPDAQTHKVTLSNIKKNLLLYCVVSLKSYSSYKNTNSNVKLNRGSYTSAHVLLNLLDGELGLKIIYEVLPSIL